MVQLQFGDKTVNVKPPGGGGILVAAAVIALVIGAFGSFYTVQQEEAGVVTRFGKHIKTVGPGLKFKIPFGVDKVVKVPVQRLLKHEFGFGTERNTNPHQWTSSDEQRKEKAMVTGDLNAALVEWVIQFRITEPEKYLFKVRNAEKTLRDTSEAVMREVVGDRTVDEVITVGRQDIEAECTEKLRALADLYELGITIDQTQLKNVDPPEPVQSSFNEVNKAQQERESAINVANGQYNKTVPKARGEAQKLITEAEGYATQRVNEAEGDAARFTALLTEYQKAPEVTRRRIYLETMEEVMPRLGNKVILDEEASQVLPFLPLNSSSAGRSAAPAAPAQAR